MKLICKTLLTLAIVFLLQNFTVSQWVSVTSGTSNFITSVNAVTLQKSFAAGFSGTFLKSTDGGLTWTAGTQPSAALINDISFPPVGFATTGWAASVSGIYKTTNEGTNWTVQITGNHSDVLFFDANTGWALSAALERVSKTTNGGTNWTDAFFSAATDLSSKEIAICNSTTLYILAIDSEDSSFVYKTTNGGNDWTLNFKTSAILNGITFFNVNTGIISGNTGLLLRTSNGGTNWTNVNSGISVNFSEVTTVSSTMAYIVGQAGKIIKSTDAGLTWFQLNSGSSAVLQPVDGLTNDLLTITCGAGGTILRTTNGGVTFVSQISPEIPERFSLKQNYPNPFNPQTNIEFNITEAGLVTLKVYDMLGKEVAMLVNDNLAPGSYSTELNASSLPSGTYFYRITSGSFTETKKMILIK